MYLYEISWILNATLVFFKSTLPRSCMKPIFLEAAWQLSLGISIPLGTNQLTSLGAGGLLKCPHSSRDLSGWVMPQWRAQAGTGLRGLLGHPQPRSCPHSRYPSVAPGDPTKASLFSPLQPVSQEARFTLVSLQTSIINCSRDREIKQCWVGSWALEAGG